MVRIGIAGIGYIAEEYIKLIVKQRITGCSLCAVSSRNLQHMETVQEKYGLEQTALFTDYQEMLDMWMYRRCFDLYASFLPYSYG